jgi:Domain of unknown function (DUF5916)/Carbohydrate family 9 binding domain-like
MPALPCIAAALLGICPFSGRDGRTAVAMPRLEEPGVAIDGAVTEPAWSRAAVLCGFSEYAPVDGRPADDSTTVLVFYSPHAIYFAIRAFEPHGAAHAAHANRDRIANDDWVEILLDTFNDRRQALVFGVNPLGVQADGMLVETQAGSKDTVDFSADFVYQSQGRLTPTGYEVEIRIPFKSIRYQANAEQQWGINVVRQVQHSGHRTTWTAARLTAASFLAQSGSLTELTDLRRGLVLDVIPEFTAKLDGVPGTPGWMYGAVQPGAGGNLRWGVTNNLTLTATARPDFSQVEADADQLVSDPREALFFPEKRPFFLEGLEQFNTPNSLVYTRRLVQPVAAIKLTGKVSGFGVGLLSGLDDRAYSASGTDNPVYNILRVRRDLGGQSIAGLVYTDKIDGADFNRVAGANVRIIFGGTHTVAMQAVESFTRSAGVTTNAPLWYGTLDRTGRHFGYTYSINAIAPDFVAASGFISRPGLANATIDHRVTRYGRPGAALESWTGDVLVRGRWVYPHLISGKMPDDQFLHFTSTWQIRGWTLATAFYLESFSFDSAFYSDYRLQHTSAGMTDTLPFTGVPRISNYDFQFNLQTPQFRRFDAALLVLPAIQDENFFEWSPAWIIFVQAGLDWRPSGRLRINATYLQQQYWRKTDGSTVGRDMVPRVKVEYQVARSLFVRAVGQYAAHWQDALRDDSRSDDPILIRDPQTGVYARAAAQASNTLRLDWLVSFTPSPGTVMYAGYGSSLDEPDAFAFRSIHRLRDGFFVKLTYLLRAP